MTRRGAVAVAVLCLATQVGCASILTGTRQTVHVETQPSESMTFAIGGAAGQVLHYAQVANRVRWEVLERLEPHLAPQLHRELSALGLEDLIATLAAALHMQASVPELALLRQGMASVPAPVRRYVLDALGIESFALSPADLELKKGSSYALVVWREGHKARLSSIGTKFNWAVLLNVFNLGLGIPIDILTGAWLNLTPARTSLTLEARRPAAAPPGSGTARRP